MKNLLVSSLEAYSGKSALIIALGLILREKGFKIMEKVDEVFGKARLRGEVKISEMRELVERFVDLKRLIEYLNG